MENVINNKNNSLCTNINVLSNLQTDAKHDEESAKSQIKKSELPTKERSLKGLVHLKQSFRTLSVPKKSLEKDKNEPTRFFGEGVTFKAKLIGILEVEEARGDRMCQEALFELKMAIRAAGEHKQRINIVIAIEGIRLRDEKTGDCLYHHPVHKISFIAQDVADSRAFGYIFGSPDSGHRFFGIKTDKAASQVVMAMRDLFQAVYELKKREVEVAKQNIEQHQLKYGSSFFLDISAASSKNGADSIARSKIIPRDDSKSVKDKTQTAGVIADLMDLVLELNSLQQGLSLTPSDPFGPSPSLPKEDPFGDSFTPPPCITTPPPAKLPPPPTSGDRRKVGSTSSAASQPELHWFDKETQELFSNDKNAPVSSSSTEIEKQKKEETRVSGLTEAESSKDLYDIFTDLDPLGTGRSKPYIDKKDFFQELKNPPKKLLKDLMGNENADGNNFSTCFSGNSKSLFLEETDKLYEDHFRKYNSVDSDQRITLAEELAKSDPYYESGSAAAIAIATAADPFETSFANFAVFDGQKKAAESDGRSPRLKKSSSSQNGIPPSSHDSVNSILKSTNNNRSGGYKPILGSTNDNFNSSSTTKPFDWKVPDDGNSAKQKIVINLRKVLSNGDDTDKENDSPVTEDAITAPKRLNATSPARGGNASSDSFESIPEPPPRPMTSPAYYQPPPPLPPKKLQLPMAMKPPPRPTSDKSSRYDYIENYESVSSRRKQLNGDVQIPPLPAPVRKSKFGRETNRDIVRHRPHKNTPSSSRVDADYYLTPIRKEPQSQSSDKGGDKQKLKSSLDITLSQLTNTGFDDLALMLRIPASALSKMTLKELTECLSRLSDVECRQLESNMSSSKNRLATHNKYSSLKESFDEDYGGGGGFTANFDDKFSAKSSSQIDKYAVFRELIEQEEKNQSSNTSSIDNPTESMENLSEGRRRKSSTIENENDRYAALRSIDGEEGDGGGAVNDESQQEGNNLKESSEKEDSAAEGILQTEEFPDPVIDEEEEEEKSTTFVKPSPPSNKETNDDNDTTAADAVADAPEDQANAEEDNSIGETENRSRENEAVGKNWAKFESEQDTPTAWRDERTDANSHVKESKPEENLIRPARYRKSRIACKRWNDDDVDDYDEEDYGDDTESSKKSVASSWDESSWRENGWSDRDSLYDDGDAAAASPTASYREQRYHLRKKGYHRKFSPHKKSPEHSPWEQEEDEEEEEEEDAEWRTTPRNKPTYKELAKEDERSYDERKSRMPPSWINDRKRRDYDEADELILLKMMLGKKRLRALEERIFFKHHHDQSNESAKRAAYFDYAKSVSKESPCGGGFVVDDGYAGDKQPRYHGKKYAPRPKSADKGRKSQPLRIHAEDTEELFPGSGGGGGKKYRKPYSHDELSISEEERWAARNSPATYRKSRSRHQSQTSPFEDNFSSSSLRYEYADARPESTTSFAKPVSKQHRSRYSAAAKRADLHPYTTVYDFKSSGRSSRESSQRQSPFEDDFTPPAEILKCCERSGDVGKGSGGDRRNDEDDEFFTSGTAESSSRNSRNSVRTSRGAVANHKRNDFDKRDAYVKEKPAKHYENVDVRQKTPKSLYYEKISKEKYKYLAADKDDAAAATATAESRSPKKSSKYSADGGKKHDPFNDPFNDNAQSYDSKTMPPRLRKAKSKSKLPNYNSDSDSAAEAGVKWNSNELRSPFTFSDQHSRE